MVVSGTDIQNVKTPSGHKLIWIFGQIKLHLIKKEIKKI
jgi:hypothetical protein